MAGCLVLVVGPSGAGKDSILQYAKDRLAGDERFVFPRRAVTRLAVRDLEDHDSLDHERFASQLKRGAFALAWQAHGLSYGIPRDIEDHLLSGRVVAVNVSRTVLAEAVRRYRNAMIVEITAAPAVLATRIAGRGRETPGDAKERAARSIPAMPREADIQTIRNDGPLAHAGNAFLALLQDRAKSMSAALGPLLPGS